LVDSWSNTPQPAASKKPSCGVRFSRAYYAAFCHVRNYARDKLGFRPRNDADDHGRLHARLKQGKLRGVAVKLERLREWRNACDYEDQLPFDPGPILTLALDQSSSVLSGLGS
jgi:hypothetical protein